MKAPMKSAQRQVIIWGRFSSDQQKDGDSKDRQDRLNRACAVRLGVKVIGEHFDPAASVKDGATPLFKKVIAELPTGVGIICENLDRINRGHPWRAKAYIADIIEAGHFIITSQDGREYNETTIEELDTMVMGDMASNVARYENNKRTTRVREEKAKAIELVRHGKPAPLGSWLPPHIKYNFDTKQYDIVKDRLAVVQRIFDQYSKGKGVTAIAKGLNIDKEPTFRFRKGWSQSTVWQMLRYEGFIGVLNYNQNIDKTTAGERIPNAFPPAIPEKLFYKVQEMCKQNKVRHGNYTATNVRNLFRGVCHCAKCGVSMRILNDDYIQCRGATLGKCVVSVCVKFSEMEYAFLTWFVEQAKDALLGQNDQQDAIKALESKLDAIQQHITLTSELIYELKKNGLTIGDVSNRIIKLESEKSLVQNEIADLKSKQSSNAVIPATFEQLRQMIDECQQIDRSITNQETRKKIADLVPSIVKNVRIDLSDKFFPSFEVELIDGQILKWCYNPVEFSEPISISKAGKFLLGKAKVVDGYYERRKTK